MVLAVDRQPQDLPLPMALDCAWLICVPPANLVNMGVYALIYGLAAIGLSLLWGLPVR